MLRKYRQLKNVKIKWNELVVVCVGFMIMFGHVLPVHADTYNLEAFLSRVESHSKDLKLAKKELDMAEVYKKEALSTALPKIHMEADYSRNLRENFLFIDFPDSETGEVTNQKFKINYKNEFGLNAVVSQTLFSFKVGTALKAAKEYKKLTDFVYSATHQAIITFSKKAFYQTLLLRKVWDVSKASRENAHENYLIMKKKFDNGQVSEFKLLQAEARWQGLVPETTAAERNYRLALNSLKNLAGIPVKDKIQLEGDFDHVPPMPSMLSVDAALERRPDFSALLWEEKLRSTGVKSESANLLPSLNLNLIYNFSSMSDEFKFDRRNTSYIVGLNLSIPVFTGGYSRAQVRKAKIELEKTRLKIDKEKEQIYNDLSNIRLRLEEARERMTSAGKTLETAKKAYKIAEITAANGLATQLELKDARVVYDRAMLNSYASTYDYLDAYFSWEQAIGEIRD